MPFFSSAIQEYQSSISLENALLNWFVKNCPAPMREEKMRIAGLEYTNFSCFEGSGHDYLTGHGRSVSRRLAAIKCVAEMLERRFMKEFFRSAPETVHAKRLLLGKGEVSVEPISLPPKKLATSNGLAVHFEPERAERGAVAEALERHLLLKSFSVFGWSGFNLENEVESSDMHLMFLASRFHLAGMASGLVVAKSPLYAGVSFGYTFGKIADLGTNTFWENAVFEAVDKIAMLKGKAISLEQEPDSWILREIKSYLETPFDFKGIPRQKQAVAEDGAGEVFVKTMDLREHWQLDFPFFASYAWSKDLIPLFFKPRMDSAAHTYVSSIFERNGVQNIPERHPVL